jgi:succinate dehydrogenase/fumarate reductase-like Fe-S protein
MTRVVSLLHVLWRIAVHFLGLPFRRRGAGLARFLSNYAPERLLPVESGDRARMAAFERCIGCGLCDTLCPALSRAPRHLHGGPSWLATTARSAVDFPSFAAQAGDAACADCRVCEGACPTGVPLRELADFVRRQARAS